MPGPREPAWHPDHHLGIRGGPAERHGSSFVDPEDGLLATENDIVTAILGERHDRAITRWEIVGYVDFSPAIETDED